MAVIKRSYLDLPIKHISILLLVIAAQVVLIDVFASGRYTTLGGKMPLAQALFAFHGIAKAALLSVLITLSASFVFNSALISLRRPAFRRLFALQCAIWAILMLVILSLPDGRRGDLNGSLVLFYGASSLFLIVFSLATVNLVLPLRELVTKDRRVLSIGVGAFLVFGGQHVFGIWFDSTAANLFEETTLNLTLWFHGFMSPIAPVLSFKDTGIPVLAAEQFSIALYPSCAGYQGMMTSVVLLMLFLAFERRQLLIVRAATVIAISTAFVFFLNAVRIALLFEIGVRFSPQVALEGFHSNFGTLSVLLVVALAMFILTQPQFRKSTAPHNVAPLTHAAPNSRAKLSDEILWQLMPLALLLTAMLVTGVFVGGFNWLYPIPIIVGALAALPHWHRIETSFARHLSWQAIAVGVMVYLIWIAIVPRDLERATMLRETLLEAPIWAAVGWLFIRIMGSAIVVPILEEIAFRGGLMTLFSRVLGRYLNGKFVTGIALLFTSIVFGLMHGAVIAATIAGLCYGLIALHRQKLGDAILAHAVTNFLIAMQVLILNDWSLW